MPEPFTVLVMAAGRGTRMHSELPKVLHPVCGKPMVEWVIDAACDAGAGHVVCITRPGDGVAEGLPDTVTVAEQTEGEGTGAAILAAREASGAVGTVVILSGDHPLLSGELIAELVARHGHEGAAATILTTEELDPTGYGRIVRGAGGAVERIVETKHTEGVRPEHLALREINIGTYAFHAPDLFGALEEVGTEHGERYLTGVFPVISAAGRRVGAYATSDPSSAMGVNDRADLMAVDSRAQRRLLERHARNGVTVMGADSIRVDADVPIGQDTTLWPGVTIRGRTSVGSSCEIGPHSTISDSVLGNGVAVRHSFLDGAVVQDGATLGPFAYLRPGARIGQGAKIGAFVEVKNSEIGAGTKVPHLSYIGDADIGENTNIGAGNITANYDGQNKHRTTIGRGVKTSVDTAFVAPVRVGDGAYTGAGSVITEDVPDGALGMARTRQINIEGYAQRKGEKPE